MKQKRNHIVLLPFPVQSHVNPLVEVARLLSRQRPGCFRFTVIVTSDLAPLSSSPLDDCIRYTAIATEHDATIANSLSARLVAMKNMRAGFEEYLAQAMVACPGAEGGGGAGEGVSCILTDMFVTWSHDVATKFDIPRLVFFTSNAHTFAAYLHTPLLHSKGLLPLTDLELRVDIMPGFSIRGKDLPLSMKERPDFVLDQLKGIQDAAGIIFNTLEAFERKPLEAIEKELVRVIPLYPIGPLLLMGGDPVRGCTADGKVPSSVSLWAADRSCLDWLDGRPSGSVLYVSFGSLAGMKAEQMRELAEGLNRSGHDFLWVVRPGDHQGSHGDYVSSTYITLPAGFQERTKGRGLIIPWAPQLEVLSHPSVGGFLTHCGWNSITENLSLAGLPMICWPHGAEQRLNARLLVDEWEVGLELQEGPDQLVSRAVVERAVGDLMQGDMGKQMKRRAHELKQAACSAVQRGGSSYRHLESLVNETASLNQKTRKP